MTAQSPSNARWSRRTVRSVLTRTPPLILVSTILLVGLSSVPAFAQAATWSIPTAVAPSLGVGSNEGVAISCGTATFCVAGDESGSARIWNGTAWSSPTSGVTWGGPSQNQLSCVGAAFCMSDTGVDARTWDGTAWSAPSSIPVTGISGVSCASATFCAAVDTESPGDLATWDGTTWNPSTTSAGVFSAVSCPSSTFCAAVANDTTGGSAVLWNGSTWTVTLVAPSPDKLASVSCASSSFCMADDKSGDAYVWNGTAWSTVTSGSALVGGELSCPSATFCVDNLGGIWQGAGWSATTPLQAYSGYNYGFVVAVTCATASFCMAANGFGNEATWNGSSWSAASTIDVSAPASVSCASKAFCMAVNVNGGAFEWTGSGWSAPVVADGTTPLLSVTCPAASFCAALDSGGSMVTWNGTSWSVPISVEGGGAQVTALSCASSSFCVAVDGSGRAVTWRGTSWSTPQMVDSSGYISGVSCPTSSFCAAVDGNGAAMTWNGTAWSAPVSVVAGGQLFSVSCVSSSFCMALDQGGSSYSWSGTAWSTAIATPGVIDAPVSCFSSSFCAAVSGGDADTWNGSSWTQQASIDSANTGTNIIGLDAVSCVSNGYCVALDGMGNALAYTTPPLAIITASLPDIAVGQSYSQTLQASGGLDPITWAIESGSLPLGLSLNAATGAITGVAQAAGTSTFTVGVSDGTLPDAQSSTATLSITVTLGISVQEAPTQTGGTTVQVAVSACPFSSSDTYAWQLDGGSISQTSCSFTTGVAPGAHTFKLAATNSSGTSTTTANVTVTPLAGFSYSIQPVPYGGSNKVATVQFDACPFSGGNTNYSWSVAGVTGVQSTGSACNVSVQVPAGSQVATLSATTTTGSTLTVTESVYAYPQLQQPNAPCSTFAFGSNACWRRGLDWVGDTLMANSLRAPDYAFIAISVNAEVGSGSLGVIMTCDGSIYSTSGYSIGATLGLPVQGVLGFGYVGDPSTAPPSNYDIDNFVSGFTGNVNAGLLTAGMSWVESPGAPGPKVGVEYSAGSSFAGLSFSGSYATQINSGDGAPTCANGVTGSPAWQQVFNTGQASAAEAQASMPPVWNGARTGQSPILGTGVTLNAESTGWAPGTVVTVSVHSTPVQLATLPADDSGNSSVNVTLPSNLPPGQHTLVEQGTDPSGAPRTISIPFSTSSGYHTVASDGGAFAFGGAGYFGSMGGSHLNKPIVGMATTSDGAGYWMVAADGGIFAFGDAKFYGSMGGSHLNAPIVAIATTSDRQGYWLVGADGGIYAFGDAAFHGSMGGQPLNSRVVGMSTTVDGQGYWMVAADGGIFSFGDASFFGSMGGSRLNQPIEAMSSSADGRGYWMVAADGGIFSFGDASFQGSQGGTPLNAPMVGMTGASGT